MFKNVTSGIFIILMAGMLGLGGCASNHHAHPVPAAAPATLPPVAPPKVVPPTLVSNIPPLGNDTTVVLSVTIKADGSVGAVGIIESSGYTDLDTAAAESVKKFKFSPATANGKPIDYVLHQSVNYKLTQ